MAERLHHGTFWTWNVYTILKSRVEILLEGNSVLCDSNTEIFPLAEKVSKLQKLLGAKRLYHRELSQRDITVFTLQRHVGHFGCCGRQDSGLRAWQGASLRLMEWQTGLEFCLSHLNCCNGTETVKPWRGKTCVRGSTGLITDWLWKPAQKSMIIVTGNMKSGVGKGSVYDWYWVFYIRQMCVSVYSV